MTSLPIPNPVLLSEILAYDADSPRPDRLPPRWMRWGEIVVNCGLHVALAVESSLGTVQARPTLDSDSPGDAPLEYFVYPLPVEVSG